MVTQTPQGELPVDALNLKIRFSSSVMAAFRSLAVATRQSPFVDADVYETLQEWSRGDATSVHGIIISMPLIAEQIGEHIRETDDTAAIEAWRNLCIRLPEDGYTITTPRVRGR